MRTNKLKYNAYMRQYRAEILAVVRPEHEFVAIGCCRDCLRHYKREATRKWRENKLMRDTSNGHLSQTQGQD